MSSDNNENGDNEMIVIDLGEPPKMEDNVKPKVNHKEKRKLCCKSCCNFFLGNHPNYFGCVVCYGMIPAVITFFVFLAIGIGFLAGLGVNDNVGLIVGIVFISASIVVPILIVFFAALYAHCYSKKHNTDNIPAPECCSCLYRN